MSESSNSKPTPVTFEEYVQICEESGILTDDMKQVETDYRVGCAMADVTDELVTAMESYPAFHSAHEGFGVLKEEVDELWEHVKVKQGGRDIAAMRAEAIQIAAMAIRFAADVCHDEAGQN